MPIDVGVASGAVLLNIIDSHPDGRAAGLDAAVQVVCASPVSIPQKRKAILMVGGMRHHTIRPEDLREQPYGIVAQCQNCGMIIKAPATLEPGAIPIQGRGTEFRCPAYKPTKAPFVEEGEG